MNEKKTGAIIQARIGSTRLPGKVLMEIGSKPLLEIIVNRLIEIKELDEIIVATSDTKQDNQIEDFCKERSITCFRGSEENVLKRFKGVSDKYNLDTIVRVTGDNPLTSPEFLRKLLYEHHEQKSDYTYPKNVPTGTGVEIVEKQVIDKIYKKAVSEPAYEHVTYYVRKYPNEFEINFVDFNLDENIRLTVDTKEDLEFIKRLYENMGGIEKLSVKKVLKYLSRNPELKKFNSDTEQKKPANEDDSKITVLIRTYNSEEYVERSVESALNQTLMDDLYEILIVDDGSKDNTKEIVNGYLDEYPNMIRKFFKEHTGPIDTLNFGIKESDYKYIILLDSDDEFEPTILEKMLKTHEKEDVGFVCCNYFENHVDDDTKVISLDENIYNAIAEGIMFKRGSLKSIGYYDENLILPEYDVLVRLKEKEGYKHISEPLFTYYRRKNSLTKKDSEKIKKGIKEIEEKYDEKIPIRDY